MLKSTKLFTKLHKYYNIFPQPFEGFINGSYSGATLGTLIGFGSSTYCYLKGDTYYNTKLCCVKYSKTNYSILSIPIATTIGTVVGAFTGCVIGGFSCAMLPFVVPGLVVVGPIYGVKKMLK